MDEILFECIKAVLIVGLMAVIRYVIPYLKAKTKASDLDMVYEWVLKAVEAQEQTVTESGAGSYKKSQVWNFIWSFVESKQINITEEQLDNLIESAVYAIKKGGTND